MRLLKYNQHLEILLQVYIDFQKAQKEYRVEIQLQFLIYLELEYPFQR